MQARIFGLFMMVLWAGWCSAEKITLNNPSFESPAVGGWTQVNPATLTGWTSSSWNYAALWPGQGTQGTQCLYINTAGADIRQMISGVAGPKKTFKLEVDARANQTTDNLVLVLAVGGTMEVKTIPLTNGQWVTGTLVWTMPDTIAANSDLWIGLGGDNTDIDVDNVRLSQLEEPEHNGMPRYQNGIKGQALEMNYRPSHQSRFIGINNRPGTLINHKQGTVSVSFRHKDTYYFWESLFDFRGGFSREKTEGLLKEKGGIAAFMYPGNASSSEDPNIANYTGGRLALEIQTATGSQYIVTNSLNNDQWYQMTVTWQDESISLYLDGNLVGSQTISGGLPSLEMAANLWVASNVYGECMFQGYVDEFLLLNRSMSAAEVTSMAAGQDFSHDAAMTAYMSFDGTICADLNRLPATQLAANNILFNADIGEWHYRAKGNIPMKLSLPPETAATYTCNVQIKNFTTDAVVYNQTFSTTSNPSTVTEQSLTATINTYGVYEISVTVQNSAGETVFSRCRDFGLTIEVPAIASMSSSYPLATHTTQMPFMMPCAAQLGMKWTRTWGTMRCPWSEINPDSGVFYWDWLDKSIDALLAQGHDILFCIQGTPDWTKPAETFDQLLQKRMTYSNESSGIAQRHVRWVAEMEAPTDMVAWENFLRELFRRYNGKIKAYELLNEPNSPNYFGTPGSYVQMLNIMHTVAAQEDPNAIIVGGAGDPGFLQWSTDIINLGAAPYMDVLSGHNYIYADPISWQGNALITQAKNVFSTALGTTGRFWSTENGTTLLERNEGEKPLTQAQFVAAYGSETISQYAITCTYEAQSVRWDIQSIFTNLLEGAEIHYFHPSGWIDAPNLKGVAFAAMTRVLNGYQSISKWNIGSGKFGAYINTSNGTYRVLFANSASSVSIFNSWKSIKAMDMYGNTYYIQPNWLGYVNVSYGPDPIFLLEF